MEEEPEKEPEIVPEKTSDIYDLEAPSEEISENIPEESIIALKTNIEEEKAKDTLILNKKKFFGIKGIFIKEDAIDVGHVTLKYRPFFFVSGEHYLEYIRPKEHTFKVDPNVVSVKVYGEIFSFEIEIEEEKGITEKLVSVFKEKKEKKPIIIDTIERCIIMDVDTIILDGEGNPADLSDVEGESDIVDASFLQEKTILPYSITSKDAIDQLREKIVVSPTALEYRILKQKFEVKELKLVLRPIWEGTVKKGDEKIKVFVDGVTGKFGKLEQE